MNKLFLLTIVLSAYLYYNTSIETDYAYYDLTLKKCHPTDLNYTIHGVWPELDKHNWPSFCNKTKKFNYTALYPILPELTKYWYSCLQTKELSNETFWQHEYLKHGVCTQFNEIDYFNWTLHLFYNATNQGLIDQLCPSEGTIACMIPYNLNWTLRN